MSRKPRFQLVGVPQHVIQRGNNREPCFHGAEDCQRYLGDLHEAAGRNHCRLHAYVLMTNHVHLLVTPMQEHGMPHLMQDLGRKYVRYINHTYRRTGTLWEGRYKSSLIDSDAYLLTCMRYIELNPVRARMVEHPGEYRWSSYAANAQGQANPLLSAHPLYEELGSEPEARRQALRHLAGELNRGLFGGLALAQLGMGALLLGLCWRGPGGLRRSAAARSACAKRLSRSIWPTTKRQAAARSSSTGCW